jgi:hypothetical protein
VPTHDELSSFINDFARLNVSQIGQFRRARKRFVESLRAGRFAPVLRVKRVTGYAGVWEMSWAQDGRATFEYGAEVISGEPHVVWRRIGTHDIFERP